MLYVCTCMIGVINWKHYLKIFFYNSGLLFFLYDIELYVI